MIRGIGTRNFGEDFALEDDVRDDGDAVSKE